MAAFISCSSIAVPSSIRCSSSSSSSSKDKSSDSVKIRDDWRSRSKPIRPGGVYPAKDQCSRCGLCDTYFIAHVKNACAILGDGMSRIEELEPVVHGRGRGESSHEVCFGVHEELLYAKKTEACGRSSMDMNCNNYCSRNAESKYSRSCHLCSE